MICVVLAEAMETQSEPEKEPKPRRRRGRRRATKSEKEEEQPEEEQPAFEQSFPILQSEKPKLDRLDELNALMDQNRAKKTDNTHNGIGWCWAELLLHRVNSEAQGLEPKDPVIGLGGDAYIAKRERIESYTELHANDLGNAAVANVLF